MPFKRVAVGENVYWLRNGKGNRITLVTEDETMKARLRMVELADPKKVSLLIDEGDGYLMAIVDMDKIAFVLHGECKELSVCYAEVRG